MARKKVIDLQADKCIGFGDKPGQKRPGQTVEGYYIGSRKVNTDMGPSVLHILQTGNGENLGVWGSAQLNGKLEQIDKGCMVFITYKKKIKVPKGTMKVFDVEYDDEDTIHVEQADVNFRSGSSSDEEEYADEVDESLEADAEESEELEADVEEVEEESEPTPPPAKFKPASRPAPSASAVSPEARARAQALLGKKRQ